MSRRDQWLGTGRRWAAPVGIGIAVIAALMIGVLLARQVYSKPHLSAYMGGHDGSARLTTINVGSAPNARPANGAAAPLPAVAPTGGVLPNPNNAAIPAATAPDRPYGPPVARTDWVITKDYAAHGGHGNWGAVDFAFWHNYQSAGSPLVATHAGRIKLLRDDPTYGNLVYVVGAHFSTTYGHMQKFVVTDGQQVVRGTVLGEMGSTGKSSGPHVDYQVWQDGDNKNPMDYGISGLQGAGPMHP
ncbi:MAG: M23 family metallopeptidase [Chloroflexota bacterium]|nr:M23 family metallopeptidase [Chloroflexota bacterium]